MEDGDKFAGPPYPISRALSERLVFCVVNVGWAGPRQALASCLMGPGVGEGGVRL